MNKPFAIVGVGASAGGLEAFTQLLAHLPNDTGMAFVLIQHLDPEHKSVLVELLSRATTMPVREVVNEMPVAPNRVYVIPPNTKMLIRGGVLELQGRPKRVGALHSIDFFFEALAQDLGERAIGVILSGTASDGTLGLEAIKAEGGITFAQDESAKYDSMPRSAIAAGCVDFVLSPDEIVEELTRISRHPLVTGRLAVPLLEEETKSDPARKVGGVTPASRGKRHARLAQDPGFAKVLLRLRNHSGVDFSLYKNATIQRRITRRMVLSEMNTLEDYASFLRGNTKELDALHSDVLINVTSFFRNPEAFDTLKGKIFPQLSKQRYDEPLRVWVLGCSTGQEAYSLAMAYTEFCESAPHPPPLQIFATDLNDAVLEKARAGIYLKSQVQDIPPERLRRFFVEEGGSYRITKALREMCVFAHQDLLSDPPFSRMDLISCRNLLIYIEPVLQKRILPTLHYALEPKGFLFLGASESISPFEDLFEAVDKKFKIFSRRPGSTSAFHMPVSRSRAGAKKGIAAGLSIELPEGFHTELNAQREADRATVNRHSPPGVLINEGLQVLQFRGPNNPYLGAPRGRANFNLLKMAGEGLMLPLRAVINKAKKQNKVVRKENLRVKQKGDNQRLNIEVIPLKNLKERYYLILFEAIAQSGPVMLQQMGPGAARQTSPAIRPSRRASEAGGRIAALEKELAETRDYLQEVQEHNESTAEELQASSEEAQSANEELQSINEELETSKEELESTNEELITVNEEMANRNAELNRLNSDLSNLHLSVNMAILVLGPDLTIRRFTPLAEKAFNLLASDVGRPLSGIKHTLNFVSLEDMVREVIDHVRVREREVRDKEGRWYVLRARPYMTLDNRIDGAVLVLVDIDALKRSGQEIKQARDYAQAILRTAPDPFVVLRVDLRVNTANEAFYEMFKLSPAETEGRLIYELENGLGNIPELRRLLEEIRPENKVLNELEVTYEFQNIGKRTMRLRARRLDKEEWVEMEEGNEMILLSIEDLTERMQIQAALRASELRYRRLFEAAKDGILILDPTTRKISDANPFMTELLGYSHGEFLGKELWEIGLLKDRQANEEAFHSLQQDGYIQYDDLPLKSVSGERRQVEFVSNLYAENGGKVIQCNIRDITNRREAEERLRESEERHRFTAESMPQKVFTATPSGEIDYFNRQWTEFTGLSTDQMKNWDWTQLIHPDDVEENVRRWNHSIATGEPFQIEHRLRRKDGVYRWHLSRAHAMSDPAGKVRLWIGSNTDIDNQKQVAAKLEETVAERTTTLRETLTQLEEFSSSISHDLRAPLRAMQGYANAVLKDYGDLIGAQGKDYLERIVSASSRMDRLTNDVLAYSKVALAKVQSEPVSLNKLVREFIDQSPSMQLPKAEIRVEYPLLDIMGHGPSLLQAISNVLSNAVKFVSRGTTPKVRVWTEPHEAQVRLWIEDNGIGIKPEHHQHIFGVFERVHPEGQYEGTGIGLAIVRKTVEKMSGKVGVESDGKKGSKFWIQLPAVGK